MTPEEFKKERRMRKYEAIEKENLAPLIDVLTKDGGRVEIQRTTLSSVTGRSTITGFTNKYDVIEHGAVEEYECFHCAEKSAVWVGDFTFEDFGYYGGGVVHELRCRNCGAQILVKVPVDDEEEENE